MPPVMIRYGPNKTLVNLAFRLSLPVIRAGKRWSSLPVLKWIINPFFAYPYNEVTAIPIQVRVDPPESAAVPLRVLMAVIGRASEIFVLDRCICRHSLRCTEKPVDIGCMAFGRAIRRIHPSHGRRVSREEAVAHARRAGAAGLIASVAHTWIDPVAFGLPDFRHLMFVCFCDDCCCIYRTDMRRRGPNLDRAFRRLPGISVAVDPTACTGCGLCAEACFVGAARIEGGIVSIGDDCRGCGRCVETCPTGALRLDLEDEETLVRRMLERIEAVADIG